MTTPKGKCAFLIAAFMAVTCGVGLVQLGVDIGEGRTPRAVELFMQKPTQANLRAYERNLGEASWFGNRLRPRMQYLEFLVLRKAGSKAMLGRDGWLFYRPGVEYLVEPWPLSQNAAAGERNPVVAILEFCDQLAARGIELVVVPIPGKASVYPEMLTSRAVGVELPLQTHTRDIMSQLEQAGVTVVDLFEVFARARDGRAEGDGPSYYLRRDTHWSPAGMHLAAKTTAETLLELGLTTRGETDYELRPVTVSRHGDVVRMMDSPQLMRHFQAEHVRCAQVLRRGSGELYQDDPRSEILVLGDSFLRIYEQDEPGAAGFVAHLARELQRPLASLVNDGGASTLVRQSLARQPELLRGKKLVLWEFVERDIRFGTEGWQKVPLPADHGDDASDDAAHDG